MLSVGLENGFYMSENVRNRAKGVNGSVLGEKSVTSHEEASFQGREKPQVKAFDFESSVLSVRFLFRFKNQNRLSVGNEPDLLRRKRIN